MITREQSVKNFKDKMAELVGTKYILADKKIGEVLRAIASSRMLYELFEHVTENFDYATFKTVCFNDSPDGKGTFTKPGRDEDFVALVFLVLMEIDNKKEDVFSICNKYFFVNDGKQACFDNFAVQMLIPFELLTEKIAYKLINGQNEPEAEQSAPEAKETEEPRPKPAEPPKSAYRAARRALSEEKKKLQAAKKMPHDEYEETAFVLDSLGAALKEGDEEKVAVCFIAYKYVAAYHRKLKFDVSAVEKAIAEERSE